MPIVKFQINNVFLLIICLLSQVFISLKVMLMRGPFTFLVLGSSCHQHGWQRSFISKRLPSCKEILIFFRVFLC